MGEQLALFDKRTMAARMTWARHHGPCFDLHCKCGVVYRKLRYDLFERHGSDGGPFLRFRCPACGCSTKILDHSCPSPAP